MHLKSMDSGLQPAGMTTKKFADDYEIPNRRKQGGSLWEWLPAVAAPAISAESAPATIKSRQPAFAKSYGGHEMPVPQKSEVKLLKKRGAARDQP
jgi:hypothetical protein